MKLSRKIIFVNLIPLIILIFGSILSGIVIQKDQKMTQHFLDTYSSKEEKLYQIFQSLGYTGGIHAFKNYILRFDEKYYHQAKEKLSKANTLIKEYLSLPELSSLEIESMQVIAATVKLYLKKLNILQELIQQKKNLTLIDKAVKVDDTPAMIAIDKLRNLLTKNKNLEIIRIDQSQKYAITLFTFSVLITILVAFLLNSLFLKKILVSLKKVNSLSLSLANANYNHDFSELTHLPEDELKEIGQQLISMGLHLNIAFENLARSNRDLSQFAFVASHDMQEPAKKLYSYSELLEISSKDQLSPQALGYIDAIKSSSKQLIDLVSALLNYANITMDIKKEFVDLNDVLNNALQDLSEKIKTSETQIEAQNLPTLNVQPQLIQSLFYNLISNAIKYRKKDQANHIYIKAQEMPHLWIFEFIDTGIGFDMKNLNTILRPFGRLHSKADIPGLGIGLPLCQRIVQVHGSTLEIYSREQEGTRIQFTLDK